MANIKSMQELTRFTFSLDKDLKNKIVECAMDERMSISSFICSVLTKYVNAKDEVVMVSKEKLDNNY